MVTRDGGVILFNITGEAKMGSGFDCNWGCVALITGQYIPLSTTFKPPGVLEGLDYSARSTPGTRNIADSEGRTKCNGQLLLRSTMMLHTYQNHVSQGFFFFFNL